MTVAPLRFPGFRVDRASEIAGFRSFYRSPSHWEFSFRRRPPVRTGYAFRTPVASVFAEDGSNTLAVACSEPFRKVEYGLTIGASDARLYGSFGFFSQPEPPRKDYAVTVRLDARRVFWAEAVRARRMTVYDTFGRVVRADVSVPAGLSALAVPPSGYLLLRD